MVVGDKEIDGDVPPRNEEHRAMVVVHDDVDGFKKHDEAGDIHIVTGRTAIVPDRVGDDGMGSIGEEGVA